MRFYQSWLGYVLAGVYIAAAIPFIHRALNATGGWISLKGLDIALATIPSSFTFGLMFEALGWRPNYSDLGVLGYLEIAFHVLVTAAVVYAIGYGIEWAVRRLSG
jgi:hypothetical protein